MCMCTSCQHNLPKFKSSQCSQWCAFWDRPLLHKMITDLDHLLNLRHFSFNLEVRDINVIFVSTWSAKGLDPPKKSLPAIFIGGPLKTGRTHFLVKRNLNFSYLGFLRSSRFLFRPKMIDIKFKNHKDQIYHPTPGGTPQNEPHPLLGLARPQFFLP